MSQRRSYRFSDFLLRPATRELIASEGPVMLSARAFDCLVYLIEHRERAVGRDELASAVWGSVEVSEAQLSQSILRARRAVGDAGNDQHCIRTVHRFGYHWVAETIELLEAEPEALEPAVGATASASVEAQPEVPAATAKAQGAGSAVVWQQRLGRRAPRRSWRLWIALCAVLAMAIAWLVARPLTTNTPEPVARPPARVLVMPIEVAAGVGADWVRLGAIDVVANRMRAAGLPVPPSETMIAMLRASGDPADTETLRDSAEWIVKGRAMRSARGWRVSLEAIGPRGDRVLGEAEAHDVLDAFRETTDALLRQLGYATPAATTLPHSIEEPLQRVQAALLENDLDAARRILGEAPGLLADEPELRFQQVLIDFRAGRLAQVESALRQLLDSPQLEERAWLRARAHTLLGSVDLMLDQAVEAEEEFSAALTLLDAEQHPLDYARALGGRGAARATQERYAEGLADLGQSRLQLHRGGDELAQARMDLMIGSLELLRGNPAAARSVLTDAIARLQRFGAWNERMHGYSELVSSELALLDYASAEAASDSAMALIPKVENGFHRAEAYLYRMQLLILQGRLAAADALQKDLAALNLPPHPRFDGIAHALRAALAETQGESTSVISEATRAIELLPINEKQLAAQSVLLRQRAWLESGQLTAAEQAIEQLPDFLLGADAPLPVRIALAELQLARSQPLAAESVLNAALAFAESAGLPAERLRVTESLVNVQLAAGRLESAGSLLGRLIPVAQQSYAFALLELRLSHAQGDVGQWSRALERATRLAGERLLPPSLLQSPVAVSALAPVLGPRSSPSSVSSLPVIAGARPRHGALPDGAPN